MLKQASRTNPRTSPKLDYSVRYEGNYSTKCTKAWKEHEKLGGLCVCCLKAPAAELHHTSYGGKPLSRLYDNWFPVCERCHTTKAHSQENWTVCRANRVWGNRNTEEFRDRLILGVNLLRAEFPQTRKECQSSKFFNCSN